jgi:hypothetical protein
MWRRRAPLLLRRAGRIMEAPVPLPEGLTSRLAVPAIAAPMFLTSGPDLVVAACPAGVIGTFPALNQRTTEGLRDWLCESRVRLAGASSAAPFGVNLVVHRSNPWRHHSRRRDQHRRPGRGGTKDGRGPRLSGHPIPDNARIACTGRLQADGSRQHRGGHSLHAESQRRERQLPAPEHCRRGPRPRGAGGAGGRARHEGRSEGVARHLVRRPRRRHDRRHPAGARSLPAVARRVRRGAAPGGGRGGRARPPDRSVAVAG